MLFRTHPGYDKLSRLADGELPPAEAMEINGHLAQCDQCREEVDFMSELRDRLREFAVPGPPSGLLPDILDRRESGQRVVLPLAQSFDFEAGGRSRARMGAAALAVIAVLAATGFFVLRPGSIRAGSTSLEVQVHEEGRPVEVAFETAGRLAGESILRVRAEYFTAGALALGSTRAGTLVEGDLRSRGEGEYGGEVLLPPTVAYARFVVEDFRGEVVERDHAEGWEYLARNEAGEPTFEALWQRTLALENVAPRQALESARELTERFPDRSEGWRFLMALLGGPNGVPNAPPVSEFVERLPPDPRPDELAAIADYARRMGSAETARALLDRIGSLDPRHPAAVHARVASILGDMGSNPPQLLAALETEWREHGQPQPVLLMMGLDNAIRIGDREAALRWADRWVAADPTAGAGVAAMLGRLPALRPVAIRRLRLELDRLDNPAPRALGARRADRQRAIDGSRSEVLTSLGALLFAEGEWEAASDALTRAAAHAWDSESLERLVAVSDRLGWGEVADRYRIRLAADPLQDEADRRRITAALGLPPADLERRIDAARREMLDGGLGSTRDRIHPSGPIHVVSLDGGPRDLAARLGHAPTLVQFWTPLLPSSVELLETLLGYCERLSGAGVRLIAVAVDPVAVDRLPEGHETCPGVEILVDSSREARLALRSTNLSEGVLIDRDGQVRARFEDATDEARAALVLAALE